MSKVKFKMTANPPERYGFTTNEFAAQHLVLPQTVRKQYAATGSYFGVIPLRLPNRKLLWPSDTVANLILKQGLSYESK